MAVRVDWSDEENGILVNAYLDMLRSELKDEEFVKAEVNRRLQGLLNGRSKGSIEFKLANVSAVLRELSFRYHLYRLLDFPPDAVRFYTLRGDLRQSCDLRPESFTAMPVQVVGRGTAGSPDPVGSKRAYPRRTSCVAFP